MDKAFFQVSSAAHGLQLGLYQKKTHPLPLPFTSK